MFLDVILGLKPAVQDGVQLSREGTSSFHAFMWVLTYCQLSDAQLSEKDEEVLKHLTDITVSELAPEPDEDGDEIGGFKLSFHFSANPFFSQTVLVRVRTAMCHFCCSLT